MDPQPFLTPPFPRLRCGESSHEIRLEGGRCTAVIAPRCPQPASPEGLLRAALQNPYRTPPLREMAAGLRTAAILVPGKDRVARVDQFLPLILEELQAAGMQEEGIEVVLATGTHARHMEDEIRRILGVPASTGIRFRQHDSRPGPHLVQVGTTSLGTTVELDRRVVEADLRILTGQIIPHYFAGFGGGRKALLPGVASHRTILQNHRRVLDPEAGVHPAVDSCSLDGNPVHLDMLEAAGMVGTKFLFNTLVDGNGRIVAAVAGDMEAAHAAGCALAEDWYRVRLDAPVDVAIASAGGWPFDCDFVQSLKALFGVREIVRPGGAILWIAQCRQGMKEGFRRWAAFPTLEALEQAVRADYDLAGHNSVLLRSVLRHQRVGLVSDLPAESVRALGIEALPTVPDGLAWVASQAPAGFSYAVAPHGNLTHAVLREAS